MEIGKMYDRVGTHYSTFPLVLIIDIIKIKIFLTQILFQIQAFFSGAIMCDKQ